jgi:hypothetical protein
VIFCLLPSKINTFWNILFELMKRYWTGVEVEIHKCLVSVGDGCKGLLDNAGNAPYVLEP